MTGNASMSQYATVTPAPPVGPSHPGPLPMTGQNMAPLLIVGVFLVSMGAVVAAIVKRWP